MSRHWRAALLFALLLLPPIRKALEASMTWQMLAQIPLLALAGAWLGAAVPPRLRAAIDPWNRHGVTGLLLATLTAAFWMLPRTLDAAGTRATVDLAKYLSVSLLLGLPLALSWPRAGFVVRGVFVLELIATCFRLGWLYLATPVRLCTIYPFSDQRRLGEYLIALGVALVVWIAGKLFWGGVGRRRPQPVFTARGAWRNAGTNPAPRARDGVPAPLSRFFRAR
ncbi:MAG: hypothetical protein KGJ55_11325 [Gammaproteobacteria bacterium]|nr:hypothetical protein [Gammaproteobacteria bacterium]